MVSVASEDGEELLGGGVRTDPSGFAEPVITSSGPEGNAWSARVVNGSGAGRVVVTPYVICAGS